ncbi:hypothetical protein [Lyngbya confervoides]|uniref:Uncharacterized protein n=1 Tax=Lyngbya confervoides BDU141951 TaxID=1574623 RepID=A0ABD4T3P3_9CYAN|nr:hypothetical protein [Lyngbya confervoides]MCM1983036.1 hypothetical protein [Lyngbya confervoides BDU141951]
MKARLEGKDLLIIAAEDCPSYKRGGSVVRNSYFWALKAIAGHAPRAGHWEYESEVWLALRRILLAFQASGYLGLSETQLEFNPQTDLIPEVLWVVSTWQD